jgi:hypothetical protein
MGQRVILSFAFNVNMSKCFMIRVSLGPCLSWKGRVKVAVQILTTVCSVSNATDWLPGGRVSVPSRVFFLLAITSSSSPSFLPNGHHDSLPESVKRLENELKRLGIRGALPPPMYSNNVWCLCRRMGRPLPYRVVLTVFCSKVAAWEVEYSYVFMIPSRMNSIGPSA